MRETSDNDLPLVDRRARSGTVLRILLLALVLIAAAAAFVYFKNSLENEIVLGILGVLAMMGIFFWFFVDYRFHRGHAPVAIQDGLALPFPVGPS